MDNNHQEGFIMQAQEHFTQSIVATVESVVLEHLGDDVPLTMITSLEDDLDIDSIELVDLGIKLERAFGITLSIADVRRCATIADLSGLVQGTQQQKIAEG
jgi:acyl carrier protein